MRHDTEGFSQCASCTLLFAQWLSCCRQSELELCLQGRVSFIWKSLTESVTKHNHMTQQDHSMQQEPVQGLMNMSPEDTAAGHRGVAICQGQVVPPRCHADGHTVLHKARCGGGGIG